jgi:hypothetical protein
MRQRYDQCIRCGAAVRWGDSTCRQCNPAGLPGPSASQFHATALLAVFGTIVLIALVMLLR